MERGIRETGVVVCSLESNPSLTQIVLLQSSTLLNMGTETNKDDRNTPEYLAQLLKDKKQIQALPNVFVHVDKLLDEGKSISSALQIFNRLRKFAL